MSLFFHRVFNFSKGEGMRRLFGQSFKFWASSYSFYYHRQLILFQCSQIGELDDKMRWLKNFERLLEIQRNIVWPSILEMEPKVYYNDYDERMKEQWLNLCSLILGWIHFRLGSLSFYV